MARYSRTDYVFSARCPNDSRTGRRFSVSGKGGVGTGENAERKRRQTESKTPYPPCSVTLTGFCPATRRPYTVFFTNTLSIRAPSISTISNSKFNQES